MNSMTGFGRAEISRKEYRLQLELVSVNSRFLECVFRMPRALAAAESRLKEKICEKISRGKITVTVNLEESPDAAGKALIDPAVVAAYYRQLVKVKKNLKLPGEVELGHIMANPELLAGSGEAVDEARLMPEVEKLLARALTDLKKMRAAEGKNLKLDMSQRLNNVGNLVAAIEKQSPENVIAYKKRLEKRIADFGNGIDLDPGRLAEEVTVYTERSDVTEECIRMHSHIDMFGGTLKAKGDAGKRLNFILQEMAREANTIGSKSVSSDTSGYAISLKEELEKLREQAQNIE
jgi:uncharacterized protein (TIGR00255 family)